MSDKPTVGRIAFGLPEFCTSPRGGFMDMTTTAHTEGREMTYDTGGMPDDWTPPPPPDVGSKRWLDDMAFSFMVESFGGLPDRSGVFKLPNVVAGGKSYPLGYFILLSRDGGKDYFRVDDIETLTVKPTFTDGNRA